METRKNKKRGQRSRKHPNENFHMWMWQGDGVTVQLVHSMLREQIIFDKPSLLDSSLTMSVLFVADFVSLAGCFTAFLSCFFALSFFADSSFFSCFCRNSSGSSSSKFNAPKRLFTPMLYSTTSILNGWNGKSTDDGGLCCKLFPARNSADFTPRRSGSTRDACLEGTWRVKPALLLGMFPFCFRNFRWVLIGLVFPASTRSDSCLL